jgi:IS30 family transposase
MTNHILDAYVKDGLELRWSPDQIAGRSKMDFAQQPAQQISRQTIYTWIGQQGADEGRWRALLRRGVPRPKKERFLGCVSITGRPTVVDRRRRYGDWEGDTVVGTMHRNGILTTVERKSGYLRMAKLANLKADTVVQGARRSLGDLPPALRRTLTLDNGTEFAQHGKLSRHLQLAVYYAKPYCAWQRGTNENTNGLLRQYFPKGTDLSRHSADDLAAVAAALNSRPRKTLDWKTPAEAFNNYVWSASHTTVATTN